MDRQFKRITNYFFHSVLLLVFCIPAWSAGVIESHGFSLFGSLKYPESYTHLQHVNPQPPQGGELKLMGFGTFDTLNPYTLKGTSPYNSPGLYIYGFGELTDSLLGGSGTHQNPGDEKQSAYGLIASHMRYPENITWVDFILRDEARFQDGHPITAEDVVFSWQTLIKEGHPRFRDQLRGIQSVVARGPKLVHVEFNHPNARSDVLRFGEMPVLPKHYWEGKDFSKTTLEAPVISGPYKVEQVDAGKSLKLVRDTNYWGNNLPLNKGRYNFSAIRIDFYRDQTVAFEAFKKGEFDIFVDYTAKNWVTGYDFPAVSEGRVIKQEIPHQLPSGTQGFFFNTRRELFRDARVRQALALMFDFEWSNAQLFHNAYRRNKSYFPNSDFSAEGLPSGEELSLLSQFRAQLPPELFTTPLTFPLTSGDGQLRPQIRQALALLKDAGWTLQNTTLINNDSQQPFEFEILLQQKGLERVIQPFIQNLKRIGIQADIRLIDTAQYKTRLDNFDFDMTTFVLSQGLSPGHELFDYFHSRSARTPGSQNYAGIQHPVIDSLVELAANVSSVEQQVTTLKALDRVLLWNHYIVPNWHLNYYRVARWNRFGTPLQQPPYTLGVENWWMLPDKELRDH